jgi:hypothetical protein
MPEEAIKCRARNRVAGCAHTDRGNRGQSSVLTFRAGHHSDCLSPSRPSDQRPQQRALLSFPPTQWLAATTPIKRTEARAALSRVVSATTVAGSVHTYQEIRGQSYAVTCRATSTVAS